MSFMVWSCSLAVTRGMIVSEQLYDAIYQFMYQPYDCGSYSQRHCNIATIHQKQIEYGKYSYFDGCCGGIPKDRAQEKQKEIKTKRNRYYIIYLIICSLG